MISPSDSDSIPISISPVPFVSPTSTEPDSHLSPEERMLNERKLSLSSSHTTETDEGGTTTTGTFDQILTPDMGTVPLSSPNKGSSFALTLDTQMPHRPFPQNSLEHSPSLSSLQGPPSDTRTLRRLGLERAASWATQSSTTYIPSISESGSPGSETTPSSALSWRRERLRSFLGDRSSPGSTTTTTTAGSCLGLGLGPKRRPGYTRSRTGVPLALSRLDQNQQDQLDSLTVLPPRLKRSVSFTPSCIPGENWSASSVRKMSSGSDGSKQEKDVTVKNHPYLSTAVGRKRNSIFPLHEKLRVREEEKETLKRYDLDSPLLLTTTLPVQSKTLVQGQGDSYFPMMMGETTRSVSSIGSAGSSGVTRRAGVLKRPRGERGVSWTGSTGGGSVKGRHRAEGGLGSIRAAAEEEYMSGMDEWMSRTALPAPSSSPECSSEEEESESESEKVETILSVQDELWTEGKRVVCEDGLTCFLAEKSYEMEVKLMHQSYSTTVYITTNNDLHIAGEKTHVEEYKRVVRMPLTADMDKMTATLVEGLLSIRVPRLARAVCKAEYKCMGSMSSIAEH